MKRFLYEKKKRLEFGTSFLRKINPLLKKSVIYKDFLIINT